MASEYRLAIKVGLFVVFFVIRQIYKSSSKGSKELSISSNLLVDSNLIEKLHLRPGELLSLINRPGTFEVLVSAKGISDRYEEIGVIEDRELSEKVKTGSARGSVEYVNGNEVKVTLTY
jgi:hypothetical protein